MTDEDLGAFGVTRRDFFKKMLAVGFAVPLVTSFALDGVASADQSQEWNSRFGNQTFGNQTFGNQDHDHDDDFDHDRHRFPNQTFGNQFHRHQFPNQFE